MVLNETAEKWVVGLTAAIPAISIFSLISVIGKMDMTIAYNAPDYGAQFPMVFLMIGIYIVTFSIAPAAFTYLMSQNKSWRDFIPLGFFISWTFVVTSHRSALYSFMSYWPFGDWQYLSYSSSMVNTTLTVWITVFLIACLFTNLFRGWVGFGLGTPALSAPKKDLYGRRIDGTPTASLATRAEAVSAFSHSGGIVIGEYTDPFEQSPNFVAPDPKTWQKQGCGPLLTMNPKIGNGHVLVITESAGFKGAGLVIPNLLTYNGPIVVIDPKGDLYGRTKAARKAMGRKVMQIGKGDGLDPFRMLKPLIGDRYSVYQTIADHLVPKSTGHADFDYFRDRSVDLLSALLFDALQTVDGSVPAAILSFISGSHEEVLARASRLGKSAKFDFVKNACDRAQGIDERGFDSFIRPITNKLRFAEFPDTADYVTDPVGTDKSMHALDPGTDIYINVSTMTMRAFAPMMRVLLGNILTGVMISEEVDNPSANRLIIVDEAKGLGNLDVLCDIRDEGRAYGLHLMMFYQTWGTMTDIWGSEVDAWIDGTAVKIFGAVQTEDLAETISKSVGSTTYVARSSSSNTSMQNASIFNGQSGRSESSDLKEARLISANRIMRMPSHGSIIISRNCKPILGTKAIYFTRNDMKNRALAPGQGAGSAEKK